MQEIGRVDFLEFLSIEERNLLASMCNMRPEFDLFFNLDAVYKEPLIRLKPPAEDVVIPQLYYFVHYHLFTTVACLLRVHLAEGLASARKAIDGALTAYRLIEHPEETESYLNGEKLFINIKATTKRALKDDPNSYPLASGLVGLHELFSQFGSHSDFSGFAHRTQIIRDEKGNVQVLFDYFHKPGSSDQFKYYFLCVLHAYLQMFGIFRRYFDNQFRIVDPSWEGKIAELERILPNRIKALRNKP